MTTFSELISASDALDLVEARFGGRAFAKDSLAKMLCDGKTIACAAEVFACVTNDIIAIWKGQPQNTIGYDPV